MSHECHEDGHQRGQRRLPQEHQRQHLTQSKQYSDGVFLLESAVLCRLDPKVQYEERQEEHGCNAGRYVKIAVMQCAVAVPYGTDVAHMRTITHESWRAVVRGAASLMREISSSAGMRFKRKPMAPA